MTARAVDNLETIVLPPMRGGGMDRNAQLRYLVEAKHDVQCGERCIANQERCVEELELHGHDLSLARSVLETFR